MFKVEQRLFKRCETGRLVVTCAKSVTMTLQVSTLISSLENEKLHSLLGDEKLVGMTAILMSQVAATCKTMSLSNKRDARQMLTAALFPSEDGLDAVKKKQGFEHVWLVCPHYDSVIHAEQNGSTRNDMKFQRSIVP